MNSKIELEIPEKTLAKLKHLYGKLAADWERLAATEKAVAALESEVAGEMCRVIREATIGNTIEAASAHGRVAVEPPWSHTEPGFPAAGGVAESNGQADPIVFTHTAPAGTKSAGSGTTAEALAAARVLKRERDRKYREKKREAADESRKRSGDNFSATAGEEIMAEVDRVVAELAEEDAKKRPPVRYVAGGPVDPARESRRSSLPSPAPGGYRAALAEQRAKEAVARAGAAAAELFEEVKGESPATPKREATIDNRSCYPPIGRDWDDDDLARGLKRIGVADRQKAVLCNKCNVMRHLGNPKCPNCRGVEYRVVGSPKPERPEPARRPVPTVRAPKAKRGAKRDPLAMEEDRG